MKNRSVFVSLVCATLAAFGAVQLFAAVTQSSTDVPKTIPDTLSTTSTLNFAVAGTITDANLTFSISHNWDADVVVSLTGPAAPIQLLVQNCGGSGTNFTNTVIDEDAGAFPCSGSTGAPFTGSFQSPAAGTMNAFDTTASNGIWTLTAADDSTLIGGTLTAWSVTLDGAAPLPVELMNFEVE